MGSSNINCSVSNLPITPDTPVRMFILVSSPSMTQDERYPFYSTSLYTPITTGLVGQYDDYGRISDNTDGDALFNIGKDHYLKGNEAFDIYNFKGKATLAGYKTVEGAVSLSFVREDVYQAALKSSGMGTILRKDLKQELEALQAVYEKQKRRYSIARMPNPDNEYSDRELADEMRIMANKGGLPYKLQLNEFYDMREGDWLSYALKPYRTLMKGILNKPIDDAAIDCAAAIAEHTRFSHALRVLGMAWKPTITQNGEVDESYRLRRAFDKAMVGIGSKELAERNPQPKKKPQQNTAKKK